MSIEPAQQAKATAFRRLHDRGTFVMPCAWDAGSARLFEQAGFAAIGTTSGGVNWSRGRPDYVYAVDALTMLADYEPVARATTLPVSADMENGYGENPSEVADVIVAAVRNGMIGASLEDQSSDPGPGLIAVGDAVERIAAAREAADSLLDDFTITARAESYFGGVDDPFADAVDRANRYVEAGANCIFIPGPADLATLQRLVDAVDAPLSLGIGSGGGSLTVADLAAVGVRRISTGGSLPRVLLAAVESASKEMVEHGSFTFTQAAMPEETANATMTKP